MLLNAPPAPQPLRIVSPYRPVPYQPRQMAQIVDVRPDVDVPVTIELGSLPLTIGLFAGSAVSFLVGSQVPSIRGVTSVVGVGLAGFGIVNLLISGAKGAKAAEEEAPAAAPVSPGTVSPALPQTEEEAFALVEGRVVSPAEGATIDVSPFGTPQVPMRVRLTNPSRRAVSFDLVLAVEEQPEPFGGAVVHEESMRVNLGADETRDFDVSIPIASWDALVDFAEVDVNVRKRPFEGGPAALLTNRFFVVE